MYLVFLIFLFFNVTATTEIYTYGHTLSLHDALPISQAGKYRQAWETLMRDNPFPAVHGRVCYHACETSCTRVELDATVSTHAVERFLGALAADAGWSPPLDAKPSGQRVLVVGAGPSRLSSAMLFHPPGPSL